MIEFLLFIFLWTMVIVLWTLSTYGLGMTDKWYSKVCFAPIWVLAWFVGIVLRVHAHFRGKND